MGLESESPTVSDSSIFYASIIMNKIRLIRLFALSFESFPKFRNYFLLSVIRKLLPRERVTKCHRKLWNGTVYKGPFMCSSAWYCPFCSSRISHVRWEEISSFSLFWKQQHRQILFVNYTVPHSIFQSLKTVADLLLRAYRFLGTSHSIRLFKKRNVFASVKVIEVKYGKNGWHPHIHELMFMNWPTNDPSSPDYEHEENASYDALYSVLYPVWKAQFIKAGVPDTEALADCSLFIKGGDYAAGYMTKFGREPLQFSWNELCELAKLDLRTDNPFKNFQKLTSLNPFHFVLLYAFGNDQAGVLFKEYAAYFKGRKKVTWSPKSIKKDLGLTKRSDEEIVLEKESVPKVPMPVHRPFPRHRSSPRHRPSLFIINK